MFGGSTPSGYSDDLYIVDLERHSVVSEYNTLEYSLVILTNEIDYSLDSK